MLATAAELRTPVGKPPTGEATIVTRKDWIMASNKLKTQRDLLTDQCLDMINGLQNHGGAIGVAQNTEAAMQAVHDAAIAAETAYDQARLAKSARIAELQNADENGALFLRSYRLVLANVFGYKYNTQWGVAGFEGNSTGVPGTVGERATLLLRATQYLAGPIGGSYVNPSMGVTVALATAAYDSVNVAKEEVNNAANAVAATKMALDDAIDALRIRMRGLIDELGQLLADDDPRWYAFGLNRPADPETPEVPAGLVYTPGPAGSGTGQLDWQDARRAKRYRVWRQAMGIDPDYIVIDTREVSDLPLTGQPVGATEKLRVTAVNDAGESAPSEELEITIA
jgi:hypothetical protein